MKTNILGKSVATAEQMTAYLLSKNPEPKIKMGVESFCRLFLYLGALEGVRGDLEFARSCWETNHFRYGGTVIPEQNNYSGHGTTSSANRGSYFPDEATGILVQIQHAKAYATNEPLNYAPLDDRYKYVQLGSAPTMEDMGGKWAVPGYDTKKYNSLDEANKAKDSYGYKIVNILNEILGVEADAGSEDKKPEETIPSVKENPLDGVYICLDAGHAGKQNRCPAIPEYYESDMAWKLTMLQKKYLEEKGASVILTRPDQNTDKPVYTRGASARGCHLFISNHSNAVGSGMNENIDYVAVYHLTDDAGAVCDDISRDIASLIAPAIDDVMGTKQGFRILTRKSGKDHNGDGLLNDNYYGVLNGARMVDVPGLILEHGFHTNSENVYWLLKDANLDRLARSEADAIAKYFSNKSDCPYTIRIANIPAGDVLNIREQPRANSAKTGQLAFDDPHKYTIVQESKGWGKLKSGIGWINLDYTVRV